MSGIKESKEILVFLAKVGESIKASLVDGKFDLSDVANFYPVLGAILPAVQGIGEIPAEIKDLSVEEGLELVGIVVAELGLEGKQAAIVKAGLKIVIDCAELFAVLKS